MWLFYVNCYLAWAVLAFINVDFAFFARESWNAVQTGTLTPVRTGKVNAPASALARVTRAPVNQFASRT